MELADLFSTAPAPTFEIGSVGWEDEDDWFFPGDKDNDGLTLVRVQLFRGRDNSKPFNETRAQGTKLLCCVSDGTFRIPPKDARCYVAIPAGMETIPGAGVIMATVSPGVETKSNPTDGEQTISAPGGGQGRVMVKKDGSVSLYTTHDNTETGKGVYLRIAPDAFEFYSPWGKLVFNTMGFFVSTNTGGRITLSAIGGIPVLGDLGLKSSAVIQADMISCRGALVKLGSGTYMTALAGLTGIAGTPSPQVMIGSGT